MEGPPPTPAPPPPPRWRGWLLIAGLILTVVLFLVPVPSSGKVEQLSYSQLKSDLAAGQVASVAIGPDGDISGKLTNGTKFTSSYPTNLQDPQFTRLLDQHNVQVTTKPAQTSIWSVLLNLLPLAIILSLFIWTGRSARRQLAGMGGSGGPGRGCSTPSGPRRPLGMWPVMRGSSGRSPRWWTSSSTPTATGGPGRSGPRGC